MHYLSLLILFSLTLVSCSNETESKPQSIRVEKHLSEKDFYQLFRVKSFQEDRDQFRGQAKEIFYRGIDSYKNKKDLDSGEYYLTNAIRVYPTANAYFELGNILSDKDYTSEALQAYQVAEGLGYEPLGSVLIQMSRVYAKMDKKSEAEDYLIAAIQGGYTNMKLIEEHPSYSTFKDSWYYKSGIRQGFAGLTQPEKFAWFQFKKQFPIVSLPLEIPTNLTASDFENMAFISYDYETYIPGMRDSKFAREVGVGHYFYANIGETENYIACIYLAREEVYFDEEEMEDELYEALLCTFTPEGKIIDLKKIAGRSGFDQVLEETKMDILGSIQIEQFALTYEKDPEEVGYYKNKVVSRAKVGERSMRIADNGKILENEPTLANTDPEETFGIE